MDTSDQPPASELLRSTAAIPIAQLSPDNDRLSQSSIHSFVTLLWPYSSSTNTLSVLLAEPDFRLRRSNGQVKVFFHGHVAEEVARTHIGIGDIVYLSLTGLRLAKNDANAATQTPGRSVSWDVHFETSAFLEIWRNSKLLSTVKVDPSPNTPPFADNAAAAPSTPVACGDAHAFGPPGPSIWQSPAFLGGSRVSSVFANSADDPFVEEDGYVHGKGRKRPRFSVRSSEWRVVDEPESPEDRDLPEDWMTMFDEDPEEGSETGEETVVQDTEESTITPAPAAVPEIAPAVDTDAAMVDVEPDATSLVAGKPDQINDNALFVRPEVVPQSVPEPPKLIKLGQASHLSTSTPRLHPVPSPGLPHPSPLTATSNSLSGYFASSANTAAAAQSMTPVDEGSESDGLVKSRTPAIPGFEEVGELNGANTLPQGQPYDKSFTPVPSKPEEEIRLDDSDNVPQVQDHDKSAPTAEHDVVTVYTDDMQVMASDRLSTLDSADAMSSPQPSDRNVATVKDIELDKTAGELGHFTKTNITEAQSKEPDSESRQQSAIDEDDPAGRSVNGSDQEKEDRVSDGRIPERRSQENEVERKQVSADQTEEGELANARGIEKFDKPRAERESLSPDDSEDELPNRSYDHDFEDENDVVDGDVDDVSDEDASNQGELEEDHVDDEDDDRDGEGYDYSESEIESDYEEESSPRAAPKNTVPEVIVLDSDSEDDLAATSAAPSPSDTANGQTQDTSRESSYVSEDQSRSGDDFNDEADHERELVESQEGEVDVDISERMAVQEPEGSNAEGEDTQRIVDERPVDGWHSESERVEEDLHDGLANHYEEDFRVQRNMKAKTTPAESPWEPNQNASANEFVTARVYHEDFHPISEYPPAPKHDSLDYLAAISESAERLHATSESAQPGHDLAIDPSLYELGSPQGHNTKGPDTEQFPAECSVEDSKRAAIDSPRSIHDRHLALRLDGAASETTADFTDMPVSAHETQQLIAPGPSQLVVTDQAAASVKAPRPIEALEDMLPTPSLTQDTLSILEAGGRPRTSSVGERVHALEGESPSPIVAVNSESEGALIARRDRNEPKQPMVIVENKIAPSPDENQALQASIEVDDQSEDSIDETSYTPGDRRYPGLRSKLSYFVPLATLIDHYSALVDTISIVSEANPPTKTGSGSKDFIMTIQLTDQSMAGASVYAQLLRPYKSALPTPREGDAILLRNFRVKSFNHSVILVSDSTSAWAVFSSSAEGADIAGPPVEYGVEEKDYATGLRHWYLEDGVAMVADYQLQASVGRESRAETPTSSLAHSDAGSIDMALREARADTSSSRGSRRRKSHRRITIHELRDGRRYTEVGSTPGEDSIHELRDGTVYANL